MKFIKLTLGVATLALGIASAASGYSVAFDHPVWIGGTQLQAGDYHVEVQGDKAIFKTGKNVVEVPATLGTNDKKFPATALITRDSKLVEIDLGGKTAKIIFSPETQKSAGASN